MTVKKRERKKKKRSGGRQSETETGGQNIFVKHNTGGRKERLWEVTQASAVRFSYPSMQTWACLSLLNTLPARHEARPRHKYTGGGVGWGHQLRPALSAIGMHSRLVCQLLANGHLAAAMSRITAVNTHTPAIFHEEDAHVNNYMQHMIYDLEKCFLPFSKRSRRGAAFEPEPPCSTPPC